VDHGSKFVAYVLIRRSKLPPSGIKRYRLAELLVERSFDGEVTLSLMGFWRVNKQGRLGCWRDPVLSEKAIETCPGRVAWSYSTPLFVFIVPDDE
jgi:hypothetical protein